MAGFRCCRPEKQSLFLRTSNDRSSLDPGPSACGYINNSRASGLCLHRRWLIDEELKAGVFVVAARVLHLLPAGVNGMFTESSQVYG